MGNMGNQEGEDIIQGNMLRLTKEMLNLKNKKSEDKNKKLNFDNNTYDNESRYATKECLVPVNAIFNDKIGEKNVLVIGLNPAGDEKDAKMEKDCSKRYLKYVKYKTPKGKEKEIKKEDGNKEEKDNENNKENDIVNNGYFKPIYELVNGVYKENETDEDKADYSRTDEDINEIINQITRIEKNESEYLEEFKGIEEKKLGYSEKIKELKKLLDKLDYKYPKCKNEYTILIGDLFYYHETNSKEFIKKINKENEKKFNKNIMKMLDFHIKKVLEANKNQNKNPIEFILINNAWASKYIIEALSKKKNIIETTGKKDITTYYEYDYEYENGKKYKIRIFFSGMLSNGGESKYGQARLLNEIREKIKKNY